MVDGEGQGRAASRMIEMYSPHSASAYIAELNTAIRMRGKEAAELSLHTFFKDFAWPIIEPKREFVDNWHLEAISEHLEAVTRRQIKRLLVNVPFRTAKSTLVSVAWPAWVWLQDPDKFKHAGAQHQWLCGSYAEKLAIRDSLKMRRLVTHPDFQANWGTRVTMAKDQNQKVRFQNAQNGYRIAFGMTGGVMGDGGDTVVIDDPHDRQGAHSEAERETALVTFDEAIITRLNDPRDSAMVIIMQRLHQKDLSGHVLAQGGWEHLMLPMRYEKARACKTSLGFKDPRKEEGELLWPERFDEKTVATLERTLGVYATAGQLQQKPSPAGGGILRPKDFQLWPATQAMPDLHFIVQSYDTAFTKTTTNDPTACTVWGIGEKVTKDGDEIVTTRFALLLDAWSDYLTYPELRKKVIADWKAEYGGIKNQPTHPARRPDLILVEEKGSGISLLQDLRGANIPVKGYNPGHADKIARAHLTSPILETGCVYVLESKREPGLPVTWARPLLLQCEQFPNGENDDYVDTLTQYLILMRDMDQLELEVASDDPATEHDYHEDARRGNPYSR